MLLKSGSLIYTVSQKNDNDVAHYNFFETQSSTVVGHVCVKRG